jgi:uncharacterized membrane protein YtjA (UPF0391 family)
MQRVLEHLHESPCATHAAAAQAYEIAGQKENDRGGTTRAALNLQWNRCRDRSTARDPHTESTMLYYALVFFVIALVAALFGFGGIAAGAAGIAKILFFLFLIIAVVTFLMSLARRP